MRYFITADDFGANAPINDGINEGLVDGSFTIASIMMNMPGTDEAIALAKNNNYMDKIGFHLNLTAGVPLTEDMKKTRLCCSNGSFHRGAKSYLLKRFPSKGFILTIRKECEEQMRRYRDAGFKSKHIDSHMWIMYNASVYKAIEPLIEKYGFKTTRTPQGHVFSTESFVRTLYFKYIYSKYKKLLNIVGDWSGCPSEFEFAVQDGKFSDDCLVELYVHPSTYNGINEDRLFNYKHDRRPISEICEFAAKSGTKIDML